MLINPTQSRAIIQISSADKNSQHLSTYMPQPLGFAPVLDMVLCQREYSLLDAGCIVQRQGLVKVVSTVILTKAATRF